MTLKHACLSALALCALGCTTLPSGGPARALYVDLRKAVDLSEGTGGWVVDRVEIEARAGSALRSVCRVDPVERARLRAWINAQIMLAGGPAREVYERNDDDLSEAQDALTLERVRALLDYAELRASEDCPFWLKPEADFAGVEGDEARFVVWLESIGGGSVVLEDGEVALGGGGGGRLLAGYGLAPRLTLALGGEIGGHGAFVENSSGARTIETTFTAAMPLVLRVSDVVRIYDFEVAPVARLTGTRIESPPGVRTLAGVGFTSSRGSTFMPYLVVYVGYEVHPKDGTNLADHSFHIGTRVGVDADP
jgi:hypothetical protein